MAVFACDHTRVLYCLETVLHMVARPSVTVLSVLRTHPSFRRLWVGALVSGLGDIFSLLALPWYVLDQTGRGDLVGALLLCFALPAVVTGPLWGRAMDRWQPRPLMLLDNGARAIVFLVIPALAIFVRVDIWVVFAVALLAGALAPATQIGVRLLIPALLPDHTLEQGNAAYSLTMQLPIVFGPMLVGALISAWGVTPTLLVNAGSFVLMGWSLLVMPNIPRGQEQKVHEDQAFTLRRWPPIVRAILGLTTLFYFAYGPFEVAFPLFARTTLDADALSYGTLWSALGVGTLFGTLLVNVLSRAGHLHTVLAWIMALWGSAMVLLAFTSTIPFALTVMFVGGVIWGPYTALETTLLQRSVPVQAQGRLFGLRTMLLGPAAPVGTALGGLLLVGMSAPSVLGFSGLACVLGAVVAWVWMRRQLMQAVAEPMGETA